MSKELLNNLREVRGSDDVISRLKAASLETRAEKIAEALQSESFKEGPADLIATYPKHVLASKDGVLMRISLDESEDVIKFGKVEVYDVPVPSEDLATEALETANKAAELIMAENFQAAQPMIKSITQVLDIKGTLANKIEQDLQIKGLSRDSWWKEVVNQNFNESVNLPERRINFEDMNSALKGSLDDLLSVIRNEAAETVRTLQKMGANVKSNTIHSECARDIAEDLKTTITLLSNVNRENSDEMQRVYENVVRVAPQLLKGARFLTLLCNS